MLVPCPACARHVMRDARVCPFCATAREADAPNAHLDEEPPRVSRSTMLLAGAAMMAGCNLSSPSVATPAYGAPAPPARDAAVAPLPPPAPAYGLPPPFDPPTPPTPPVLDASVPADAHTPAHRHPPHRRDAIPVPAYGVAPHHEPPLKP